MAGSYLGFGSDGYRVAKSVLWLFYYYESYGILNLQPDNRQTTNSRISFPSGSAKKRRCDAMRSISSEATRKCQHIPELNSHATHATTHRHRHRTHTHTSTSSTVLAPIYTSIIHYIQYIHSSEETRSKFPSPRAQLTTTHHRLRFNFFSPDHAR
jgi:hypothetical protein